MLGLFSCKINTVLTEQLVVDEMDPRLLLPDEPLDDKDNSLLLLADREDILVLIGVDTDKL